MEVFFFSCYLLHGQDRFSYALIYVKAACLKQDHLLPGTSFMHPAVPWVPSVAGVASLLLCATVSGTSVCSGIQMRERLKLAMAHGVFLHKN